jgi:hypothetical protein
MQQKDFEELQARIARIEDIQQIEQLQNRYQQNVALFRVDKLVEAFAQKPPDVSIEAEVSGVFIGIEGVRRFFGGHEQMPRNNLGLLSEHYALCPVIEVAKDGKTARGTWLAPGITCIGPQKVQAWTWGKYACDYIKEDGQWKIWHLHWYVTFEAPYEKGWLYQINMAEAYAGGGPDPRTPDKPTTYHKPFNPEGENYLIPEPPEPY